MPELGGLKGEMAPGDAHPYLALFCYSKFIEFILFLCYNIFIIHVVDVLLQSGAPWGRLLFRRAGPATFPTGKG